MEAGRLGRLQDDALESEGVGQHVPGLLGQGGVRPGEDGAEALPLDRQVGARPGRTEHPSDLEQAHVRSLVADVGERLGCGAHLGALRRTGIGPFEVGDARSPEEPGPPLPIERAVAHLPAVTLHPEEAVAASHGRILGPAGVEGPYRAVGPDGHLVGIYRDDGAKALPEVILA